MPRRNPSRTSGVQRTGEIVLSAIKKLTKYTGWTSRTIIKFVKMEYGIIDSKIGVKVSRALKRGVRLGVLQCERGRYRLDAISNVARTVTARDIRNQQSKQNRSREAPLRIRSHSSHSRHHHTRSRRAPSPASHTHHHCTRNRRVSSPASRTHHHCTKSRRAPSHDRKHRHSSRSR